MDPLNKPGKHWLGLWTDGNVNEIIDSYALLLSLRNHTTFYRIDEHTLEISGTKLTESIIPFTIRVVAITPWCIWVIERKEKTCQTFLNIFLNTTKYRTIIRQVKC